MLKGENINMINSISINNKNKSLIAKFLLDEYKNLVYLDKSHDASLSSTYICTKIAIYELIDAIYFKAYVYDTFGRKYYLSLCDHDDALNNAVLIYTILSPHMITIVRLTSYSFFITVRDSSDNNNFYATGISSKFTIDIYIQQAQYALAQYQISNEIANIIQAAFSIQFVNQL